MGGASEPGAGRSGRSRVAIAVTIAVAAAVGAGAWLWAQRGTAPEAARRAPAEDPEPPLVPPNPGYVGPATCAECHAERVRAVSGTRHARACVAPDPGTMPPGFGPGRALESPRQPGTTVSFTRFGPDFVESVARTRPNGVERFDHAIDLIYGANGGGDEVYLSWKGARLVELPMAWLHPTREWGEQRGVSAPDLARSVTPRCVECHNTWLPHVAGTENEYRREGAITGVTCENCHGPGAEHTAEHRARPGGPGRAILNPARLSRDRLTDLCAQCHSSALGARGPAFSYRPGEPLDAHFRTNVATGHEHDHVADQTQYMRASKCYQNSAELTCVTCHDPHRPTDPAKVAAACAKCHKPESCRERPKLPEAVRGECVACHMPKYGRSVVNFHTAADRDVIPVHPHEHRIAVHPTARLDVLRAWHAAQPGAESKARAATLATELGALHRAESDRRFAEHRFHEALAAARAAVEADASAESRGALDRTRAALARAESAHREGERATALGNHREAARVYEALLKENPDDAIAHGRLGTALAVLGERPKALEHLRAVARCDPDDPYGFNMIGWLAYLDGDHRTASDQFRRADELKPFTAPVNYRWGLTLLAAGDADGAAARFRIALVANPGEVGAAQGLASALLRLGRAADALPPARRAARLTSASNPDVLLTLAEAFAGNGYRIDAVETIDLALRLRPVPELGSKLRAMRSELLPTP